MQKNMNIKLFFITIIILIGTFCRVIKANELSNLALPCQGCHGPSGKSYGKSIPSIAGLDKSYIKESLKEYKLGIRKNYIMQIISNGYSDEEIEKIATFFEKTM